MHWAQGHQLADEHVDPSLCSGDVCEGIVDRDLPLRAHRRRSVPQPFNIETEQDKRCAFLGKSLRDRAANTLRCSGADGDLVLHACYALIRCCKCRRRCWGASPLHGDPNALLAGDQPIVLKLSVDLKVEDGAPVVIARRKIAVCHDDFIA